MFRPEIKVVDCTIRDGGLVNDSKFSFETVRAVYQAACESGIDYVELGYRNSKAEFSPEEFGPWRFTDEADLRKVTAGIDPGITKIAVMQDAHKAVPEDVLPKEESLVDMIRVATYVKDVDKAIRLANNATDKGYEATINIMAISHEGGMFLDEALRQLEEETCVKAVYIVDSFGALYGEEVQYYVDRYKNFLKTKEVGVHFHNNQQLAFANTIEGIILNANYLDGTMYGLGRAAGNCPLELLLGFLKNPKFNITPILKVIGETIVPLQEYLDWGYRVPYMLTGVLNQHPREAMRWMKSPESSDYVKFHSQITEDIER
ncbi:MAG: nucleoid-structuring protein H-NS [Planctomycetes bacterium]|nr:nucleoid-structuring protein H-NS [Planctomycetota bacterium]